MHEQNTFCSQTRLGDIAHEQAIIFSGQLFAGNGGFPTNEKGETFASNDNNLYFFLIQVSQKCTARR